ncbi:hypothetical protein Kpol_526p13 [Vanderwaltozyma polyspora DSM 70294]|uniref:Uncharacterized protein n=1 Tax=Vanderwaltozyma polyspora (strain ATCC 22028 / DSM 70294 / BCRC 21397 / CBS 2163 / NBRC 10782 / NRRL Y-8283 / UCD 57-17) TaxID=436907 RepID=A7TLR8_VANPO|nr:uncharacterized protein Kpol_526p13 [Vanderwaltozyma polyspora DSM 70294]EDO16760.1 hypothetical protein Kpol_526p13 [Vanderwaltozyma polyspora DSM 70294]
MNSVKVNTSSKSFKAINSVFTKDDIIPIQKFISSNKSKKADNNDKTTTTTIDSDQSAGPKDIITHFDADTGNNNKNKTTTATDDDNENKNENEEDEEKKNYDSPVCSDNEADILFSPLFDTNDDNEDEDEFDKGLLSPIYFSCQYPKRFHHHHNSSTTASSKLLNGVTPVNTLNQDAAVTSNDDKSQNVEMVSKSNAGSNTVVTSTTINNNKSISASQIENANNGVFTLFGEENTHDITSPKSSSINHNSITNDFWREVKTSDDLSIDYMPVQTNDELTEIANSSISTNPSTPKHTPIEEFITEDLKQSFTSHIESNTSILDPNDDNLNYKIKLLSYRNSQGNLNLPIALSNSQKHKIDKISKKRKRKNNYLKKNAIRRKSGVWQMVSTNIGIGEFML